MEPREYQRIVNLYIDMVYRVALNGCKNPYDAEDVVQDTFLKLLKCKKPFESDAHVRNWLIRVTINACKSNWSSPWKTRTLALDEQFEGAYVEPKFTDEEHGRIFEKVMELPPKYREPLYLYYFEEFSIKEVAQILKLSETAVQTRLQRARNMIKNDVGGIL